MRPLSITNTRSEKPLFSNVKLFYLHTPQGFFFGGGVGVTRCPKYVFFQYPL